MPPQQHQKSSVEQNVEGKLYMIKAPPHFGGECAEAPPPRQEAKKAAKGSARILRGTTPLESELRESQVAKA